MFKSTETVSTSKTSGSFDRTLGVLTSLTGFAKIPLCLKTYSKKLFSEERTRAKDLGLNLF